MVLAVNEVYFAFLEQVWTRGRICSRSLLKVFGVERCSVKRKQGAGRYYRYMWQYVLVHSSKVKLWCAPDQRLRNKKAQGDSSM